MANPLIPVALCRRDAYGAFPYSELTEDLARLFAAAGVVLGRGERVLVKPNLVGGGGTDLACTHAGVVRAACELVLAAGSRPVVADSPGLGTAKNVARKRGYEAALANLDVEISDLGSPIKIPLSLGGSVAVSRTALEADRILNLAKLKAHRQVRLTLAVKNTFGVVCGARKALIHARYGERENRFESLLMDVAQALPKMTSVLDGIVAMHGTGPFDGQAYPLGLLGVSSSAVALDTAIYSLLKQAPEDVPLFAEAVRRGLPGTRAEELAFPLERLDAFDATSFHVPGNEALIPVSFRPVQLVQSLCRRLRLRYFSQSSR